MATDSVTDPQPRILLLGAAGQLGRELSKALPALGQVIPVTREDCDLADRDAVLRLLASRQPTVIVNAAAYTAVDRAESEPELAAALNSGLPAVLATWAAANQALLVDYGTDYIFDGSKHQPWLETDPRAPLNTYGRTKCAGLEAIEGSGCDYLVFIVTWLYAAAGANFPRTILRLGAEKPELSVVCDQMGAPTPADWIAETTTECIRQTLANRAKCGLYNLVPSGSTSWCDFAKEIIRYAGEQGAPLRLQVEAIHPVPTAAYPTAARRPANSMLDAGKLKATFDIFQPHWRSLFKRAGSLGL